MAYPFFSATANARRIYIFVWLLATIFGSAPIALAADGPEYTGPIGSATSVRIYFPDGAFAVPASADQAIHQQALRASALRDAVIWVEGHCDRDEAKHDGAAGCRGLADRRAKATVDALRAQGWTGDVKFITPTIAQESTSVDPGTAQNDADSYRHAANRYVQISIAIRFQPGQSKTP